MRALILLATLALASPAFAQGGQTPPKPTVESLTAELTAKTEEVKRLSLVIQAVVIQRNQAMSQIADQAAMAEVEKAMAQKPERER